MEKAKVSVIIPCYNIASYIDRCIDSIIAQDYGYENLEIILVDDCSTDDTLSHLEKTEQEYPDNVMLIKTEENGGPGTARNIGLQYSSGDYIVFADGDDILAPSMIRELFALSLKYDCDVVECSFGIFDDPDEIVFEQCGEERFIEIKEDVERKLLIVNSRRTAVWGRLYKAEFIRENELFFPNGVYNLEDVFFSGLAMFGISRLCITNKKLYWYYLNPQGLNLSAYNSERIRREVSVIDIFVDEVRNRRHGIKADRVSAELEFYCLWNGLLDPLGKIVRAFKDDEDAMLGEALWFAKHMTALYPQAYDNVYMKKLDDAESRLALKLLAFAGKGGGME